jgi:hypothetical protein
LTFASEAFSPGDRADAVFGPFDLVPGKSGVVAGLEDVGRGFDVVREESPQPVVALDACVGLLACASR